MGKATGFLEYTRVETPHRPVTQRILDWNECLLSMDAGTLNCQSARCMDCGVSFCQAGVLAGGTHIGCPLNNLVPETNDLVYRGDYAMAFRRLSKTHPFPEITGRVCPALCEGSCTLSEHDAPVTVKAIERFLADYAAENSLLLPNRTAPSTGKTVAVVGSGPAGLACADALSRKGHRVTVFERADRPGGFLMYGIPNMKLDKHIIETRIELLKCQGVTFQLNCDVGEKLPVDELVKDFDAAVLCIGARSPRQLSAAGSGAKGVAGAVDYLTAATRHLLDGTPIAAELDAKGKDVVILGGGDTGTDCIATAIRQGAKSVAALEIMPPAPEKRAQSNPWPQWPRVMKTGYGHEEALEVFGRDVREYETTAKEILEKSGAVCGIRTVKVEWEKTANGGTMPKELPGSERERPAGLVITAMGFTGPERGLAEALGLELDIHGNIQTSKGDSTGHGGYRTELSGVFAAGDAHRGPSLVVWAIMEGMQAARECHEYLEGK